MARVPAYPHNDSKTAGPIVSDMESGVAVNVADQVTRKIQEAFSPIHLELINESHMHAGPATESHFKLILVSESFAGLSAVKRHQAVYRILSEELSGSIHALALHLYLPAEWEASASVPDSPQCAGNN